MSGWSLGANAGAQIELVRTLSVDANVGYHRDWYNQTSEGSLDPYVLATEGLVVSIGVEWRPI